FFSCCCRRVEATMAAKKRTLLLFAIAMICASSRSFASIPRSQVVDVPTIDRFSIDDRQLADDRESIDNARLLHRALIRLWSSSTPVASLSKTRVWGPSVDVQLARQVEHPLTRALRRASARSWSDIASDRTVLTPD